MIYFLLTLCLSFTACWSQFFCPSKEDIKPCTCNIGKDEKPWISCEGLTSAEDLRAAVKGMQNTKLSTFNLERSNIGVFPADVFSKIEIQTLNILFTNITSLTESLHRPPFLGLEGSLESLEIRDAFTNDNSPLTGLSLSHLKKLTFLQLEGNLMPTIGNDWFESGPYKLKELFLMDTSTSKIGSHAFMSLTQLIKLTLTGGSVSEISRDMLPKPALYLESLDLSNNQISSLPKDLFSKMASLREVFFDNNALASISEITYSQVWSQLSHVYYHGNPLKCDDGMKWIFKYRLPESLQGHCAFPDALRYRSLSNLTLADFA